MARFTALFDADVLFSIIITDLVMQTSLAGIFRARWSADIHDEWIRAVLERRPDADRAQIERRRSAMEAALPDASVTGYHYLISGLDLPDINDRHVLAAAIVGGADVIVTRNLSDFPGEKLGVFNIEAQHPDTFLIHQRSMNEGKFLECVRKCRRRMKNPSKTPDEYLDCLNRSQLVALAAELAKVKSLL